MAADLARKGFTLKQLFAAVVSAPTTDVSLDVLLTILYKITQYSYHA